MNQLISKSTSEDINTNLLAVISTQESDTMLCEDSGPFESHHGETEKKGAVHLDGSHFTNNAIADKHF